VSGRRVLGRGVRLLMQVALLSAACGIRADELECELAAAHVEDCCPDYTGSFDCTYFYSSTCGTTEYFPPAEEDMRLLQTLDCAQIQAAGLCEAAVTGFQTNTPWEEEP
jgi:hypothetical protein